MPTNLMIPCLLQVTRVSETHVLKEAAFILFYVKQGSSPWFSTVMEAQKVLHLDDSNDASPVSVLDLRDLVSPSIGETSCSNSRETQGKDEDHSRCSNLSPVIDEEGCHVATPSACYHMSLDEGSCKAMPDKFIMQCTKESISDRHMIDIFQDEPSGKVFRSKVVVRILRSLHRKQLSRL